MSEEIDIRESSGGHDETWDVEWVIEASGSRPGEFQPTPKTGSLVITIDSLGKYWNGTAFMAGSEIVLATTITGMRSVYPFVIPTGIEGYEIRMTGWFNDARGGRAETSKTVVLRIAFPPLPPLAPVSGDVEQDPFIPL